jgi:hypothetical protein
VKATVHNLTSKHLLLSEALVTRRDDGADSSLFSMRKKGKMEKRLAEWRTLLAALWLCSQRWDAIFAVLHANWPGWNA